MTVYEASRFIVAGLVTKRTDNKRVVFGWNGGGTGQDSVQNDVPFEAQ